MYGMTQPKKPRELKNDELFSIRRAAEYKGVSTRAVYQRINAGHLPYLRAGDDKAPKLVYRRDLDDWEVDRDRQVQKRPRGPRCESGTGENLQVCEEQAERIAALERRA